MLLRSTIFDSDFFEEFGNNLLIRLVANRDVTDLGKYSGLATTMAVEDAEEGVLEVLLVLRL